MEVRHLSINGVSAAYHLALTRNELLREALEHLYEQFLHRAEMVMHQPAIESGLLGEPSGRNVSVADVHEQPFGGVEECLLRFLASRRDAKSCALHYSSALVT